VKKSIKAVKKSGIRLAEVAPIVIPVIVGSFGVVAMFFLIIDQFKDYYVWPLGLSAAVAATWVTLKHYTPKRPSRQRNICNMLVLSGVLLWGVFNVFYTSQHLMTNRDPALYSNSAIWLKDHDNLKIKALNTFGNTPGVAHDDGAGFGPFRPTFHTDGGVIYAQGIHLLPIFLGLAARLVGISHMLHLNMVFGMTALLAVYGFARILVKRTWWAAVVTGALAGSMPFIYFSRDTYSEPLAATLTFGALTMIWLALKQKNAWLWLIAGLLAGAGTMTRLDGFLTVAEALLFIAIFLIFNAANKAASLKMAGFFIAGLVVASMMGWRDAATLSRDYYGSLRPEFHKEVAAIAAAIAAGLIFVPLAWYTSLLKKLDNKTRSWRAHVSAYGFLAVVTVMMSRPLWYFPMMPKHPTRRSYAELTTQWISWYIGPVLAVLGALGVAFLIYRIMKKRDLFLIGSLIVILGTAALYLNRPSIFPDQIWASRRLMPVILPGVAAFAVVTLDWLYEEFAPKVRWKYALAGIASTALLLPPLVTSKPLLRHREYMELGFVDGICKSLPDKAAVLWVGRARTILTQPTRGICDVPALGYGPVSANSPAKGSPSRQTLARISNEAARHGRVAVIGLLGKSSNYLGKEQKNLTTTSQYSYQILERAFLHPPQDRFDAADVARLGIINPDGTISSLPNRDNQ
jgi:hypothetical protein